MFYNYFMQRGIMHCFFFCLPLCVCRLGVPQCFPGLPCGDSVCSLAGGSLWRLWMVSTQAGEFVHATHKNIQPWRTDPLWLVSICCLTSMQIHNHRALMKIVRAAEKDTNKRKMCRNITNILGNVMWINAGQWERRCLRNFPKVKNVITYLCKIWVEIPSETKLIACNSIQQV